MKKTILVSSLAIALGVTGVSGTVAGGHTAHAAEQTQLKYTVQHGDTLSKIGQKYNVTVDQLKQWNNLKSDLILVGQVLNVNGQTQVQQAPTYNQTQYTTQQVSQQTQAPTQTQSYTTHTEAQQAPQQAQTVQHAEPQQATQAPQTASTQAPKQSTTTSYQAPAPQQNSGSIRLSNGNTAGATGSSAAQIMAQRTGVSASTWETIIARESNGNPNAYNPSGASGLFQTMPFHGATNTVDQQINAAVRAYNAQGLSAWGM